MFDKEFLKKIWKTLPLLVWIGFGWFFLCCAAMAVEFIWIKKDALLPKITLVIGIIGLALMMIITDITPGKTKNQNQERHQN